jgi:cyclopropane fatty-acyl-phospholipid synthase-like methyltransferase
MARQWFEELFDETYFEVYGLGLDRAPAEVDFIEKAFALPEGSAILDLACGHGRHAIELARRGYEVAGLDLSRTLLAKAAETAREAGVRVELIQEDMRAIPETWAARFDAIINCFTAWGYFETDEENEKVIEAVARSLKLGGRFFLDTINREHIIRDFRPRMWQESPGGLTSLDETRLDLTKGRAETARTLMYPDGRRVEQRISVRLFALADVRAMLHRHHLAVRETYGDWQGGEYGIDSRRMIVLAEREK